jgi:hypothetical protein
MGPARVAAQAVGRGRRSAAAAAPQPATQHTATQHKAHKCALHFFFTPFNPTLRWFYMSICFLNPLFQTRVHEIPTDFFLRLLSRHFYPRVAIVPTIRTFFSLTHDTPRSSRYIAYLRYATILYWRVQVLLLCGGHQKVIDVVGDGTELLLNNRPAESGALRFEIFGLDLCRVL